MICVRIIRFEIARMNGCHQIQYESENEKKAMNAAQLILTANQSETRSRDKTSTPPATVTDACSDKAP